MSANTDIPLSPEGVKPSPSPGARAIAEVRERYWVSSYQLAVIDRTTESVVYTATHAKICQAWIDEQAARACYEALLPVSDAVENARWEQNCDSEEDALSLS